MTFSRGRFVPDEAANARLRRRGGNVRAEVKTTPEMWEAALPGVISRLRAFLAAREADTPNGADEAGETL